MASYISSIDMAIYYDALSVSCHVRDVDMETMTFIHGIYTMYM